VSAQGRRQTSRRVGNRSRGRKLEPQLEAGAPTCPIVVVPRLTPHRNSECGGASGTTRTSAYCACCSQTTRSFARRAGVAICLRPTRLGTSCLRLLDNINVATSFCQMPRRPIRW
jgi:hypothetical protein